MKELALNSPFFQTTERLSPLSANAKGPNNFVALPPAFRRGRGEQRTDIKGPAGVNNECLIREKHPPSERLALADLSPSPSEASEVKELPLRT